MPSTRVLFLSLAVAGLAPLALPAATPATPLPFELPTQRPDRPLSAAMERLYANYPAPTYYDNQLYSHFRYTELQGFDYHGHDGTISRRDPSKIIRAQGRYYVWYTKRHTASPPQGPDRASDTIPSSDWDLSEIWYATSSDGFVWQEQGVAIPRPAPPHVGWRSVSTADILLWRGKYYLYYQGFMEISGRRGDDCPVTVSVADSPDGPWRATHQIVVPNGPPGSWDQFSIHDPYPLVYRGEIYLYYKSDFGPKGRLLRAQGLAIADDPLGPFVKHPLNPVMNSGHETTMFPFKQGIAAFVIRDGNEANTIQFAPDGVNFTPAATVTLMPDAAGPYVPDAFTDTRDGRGITWGLSHFTNVGGRAAQHAILARFDCDLSLDVHIPTMKGGRRNLPPEVHFAHGLSKAERAAIEAMNRKEESR